MPDFSTMKTGRIYSPTLASGTRRFGVTASAALSGITVAPEIDWYSKIQNWPMYGNDHLSDCTCAAVGHAIQQWTSYSKPSPILVTDSDVIQFYEIVSGYNPSQPLSDRGAVCFTVLQQWKSGGVPISGVPSTVPNSVKDTLFSFKSINWNNEHEFKSTITVFANVYLGLNMPLSAQTQEIWSPVEGPNGAPGSWGGHLVLVVGYNKDHYIVVTWGRLMAMTYDFLAKYGEEAYALVNTDFLNTNSLTPSGLSWQTLQDYEAVV